ncbi:MAG: hypothetical protein OEZ20_02325, partial [candidate division WOR-3 bacterium]|nr:hypothetical protein [candidate division WOR-3 bacterium]
MKKYVGLFSFILLLSFIYRPAQAKDLVNDVIITEEDTIYEYDVGIENFNLPDTVNPGESIPVQFTLVNYGTRIAIFDFVFEINYPDGFRWIDSIHGIILRSTEKMEGDMGTWPAPDSGILAIKCSILIDDENPNNNGGTEFIVVRQGQFIEEEISKPNETK